jgi:hypothetical protein
LRIPTDRWRITSLKKLRSSKDIPCNLMAWPGYTRKDKLHFHMKGFHMVNYFMNHASYPHGRNHCSSQLGRIRIGQKGSTRRNCATSRGSAGNTAFWSLEQPCVSSTGYGTLDKWSGDDYDRLAADDFKTANGTQFDHTSTAGPDLSTMPSFSVAYQFQ